MENKNWQDIIRQMFLKVVESCRSGSTLDSDDDSIQYPTTRIAIEPHDIWARLTEEGKFDTIKTLQRVERRDVGYGTIVTPKEGWSDVDSTHNAILTWLRARDVHVLNVGNEIECLTRALHQPQEV